VAQMPREVWQVRNALLSEFGDLIDMSDVTATGDGYEQRLISRAQAALVARRLLGCDSQQAAETVVDGHLDHGIDAIAIPDDGSRIWLIQSKWSDAGTAGYSLNDIRSFKEGVDYINQRQFDAFNGRVQDHAARIEWAWGKIGSKIMLVVAAFGENVLHDPVRQRLEGMKEKFNGGYGEFLDYEIWDKSTIWQSVRDDHTSQSVDISATMTEWMRGPKQYGGYQGIVTVAEVADWFEQHGLRLFEQNIRTPLGLTAVNKELIDTLADSPWDFWYFNNGITVLCESADVRPLVLGGSDGPCFLTLRGASVVNGAQTVMAIRAAMHATPDRARQASVSLKVITTSGRAEDFGTSVTKATNRQNKVEDRDFVALDGVQWRLRQDFALSLHKEYVYKRGEPDPEPEVGTSVSQVALALACVHDDPELAVRAKNNKETLWERGPAGTYAILFLNDAPTEWRAWRSVQVFRRVQGWLAVSRTERDGRASAIADYGELLVAHLVLRRLPYDLIDDPRHDWDREIEEVPEIASRALSWLIHRVDQVVGPNASLKGAFSTVDQCRTLVELVHADLQADTPTPELPAVYRPTERRRRPNAVATLIDAGRIAEGTTLFFRTRSGRERQEVDAWLAADPQRAKATWVNHRMKPLLWAYDGNRYSPSALVTKIWELSGWPDPPIAVRGPSQWYLPDEGSLWELAKEIQDEEEEGEDTGNA
jgi:hypothetical protein